MTLWSPWQGCQLNPAAACSLSLAVCFSLWCLCWCMSFTLLWHCLRGRVAAWCLALLWPPIELIFPFFCFWATESKKKNKVVTPHHPRIQQCSKRTYCSYKGNMKKKTANGWYFGTVELWKEKGFNIIQCGKSQGKAASVWSVGLYQTAVEIWMDLLKRFLCISATSAPSATATTAAPVATPYCHPAEDVPVKGMHWARQIQHGSRRQMVPSCPKSVLLKYKWRSEVKEKHKGLGDLAQW